MPLPSNTRMLTTADVWAKAWGSAQQMVHHKQVEQQMLLQREAEQADLMRIKRAPLPSPPPFVTGLPVRPGPLAPPAPQTAAAHAIVLPQPQPGGVPSTQTIRRAPVTTDVKDSAPAAPSNRPVGATPATPAGGAGGLAPLASPLTAAPWPGPMAARSNEPLTKLITGCVSLLMVVQQVSDGQASRNALAGAFERAVIAATPRAASNADLIKDLQAIFQSLKRQLLPV